MWAAWTALVTGHYFTTPANRFLLVDGPLGAPHFWIEALERNIEALTGAAIVLLAGWGSGGTVAHRLFESRAYPDLFVLRGERFLFRFAAGLGALACLGVALAFAGAYRPPILIAIFGALACVGVLTIVRSPRPGAPFAAPTAWSDRLFAACAAAALTFALIAAFAPETEYDALWYHLWLPARWLAAGRPVDIVEEYVSLYPLTWEMLYGAAMAAGGPGAAKLLHWACLPLLAATAAMLARALFPRASGWLAAALTITAPILLWEATTAYVDLALAWFLALGVYALLRHDATRDRRWIRAASLMFGVGLGIKHLALVAMAIALAALLIREWRRADLRRALRTAALFGAVALVLPAPWYARAFVASGNPVFPEMYALFGARPAARWSEASERGLRAFKNRFGADRRAAQLLELPWDMTVHSALYGGTLGPLFLILAPAALLRRRGPRASLVVAAGGSVAYLAVWASPVSSFQMRFLIPLVPLLAALGAEGARIVAREASRARRGGGALVAAVLVALLAANLPPAVEWHERDRSGWSGWLTHVIRGVPVGVVIGAESEDAYLGRVVPSYRAWEFINANLPGQSRVLTFSGGDQLYSARPRMWSDSTAAREATWATPAGREAEALAAAERLGITHVLIDKRQIEDGSARTIGIGTDRMRNCCLTPLYEDHRFVLYAIDPRPGFEALADRRRQ